MNPRIQVIHQQLQQMPVTLPGFSRILVQYLG